MLLWCKLSRYRDSLRAGWAGDRNPGGGRFSAAIQTGPGAHPTSHTMGTESFPGVKRPGRGVDHPLPPSAEVKERVGLHLYSLSGPSWPVLELTLLFLLYFLWYNIALITLTAAYSKSTANTHTHTHTTAFNWNAEEDICYLREVTSVPQIKKRWSGTMYLFINNSRNSKGWNVQDLHSSTNQLQLSRAISAIHVP